MSITDFPGKGPTMGEVEAGLVTHLCKVCPSSMSDPKGTSICIQDKCAAYRYKVTLSVDNPTQQPGAGKRIFKRFGFCGLAGEPW
jgi:hypothetical protein